MTHNHKKIELIPDPRDPEPRVVSMSLLPVCHACHPARHPSYAARFLSAAAHLAFSFQSSASTPNNVPSKLGLSVANPLLGFRIHRCRSQSCMTCHFLMHPNGRNVSWCGPNENKGLADSDLDSSDQESQKKKQSRLVGGCEAL